MNRAAFLRALRRYCRQNNLAFDFDPRRGKGSHGRVEIEGRATMVPVEVGPALAAAILKQLGLPADAI